jgi:hypothetical protein
MSAPTRWRAPGALPEDPLLAQAAHLLRQVPRAHPLSGSQRARLRQRVLDRDERADEDARPAFLPSPLGRALAVAGVAGLCAVMLAGSWLASRREALEPGGATAPFAAVTPAPAPTAAVAPARPAPAGAQAPTPAPTPTAVATSNLPARVWLRLPGPATLELGHLVAHPGATAPRLELMQRQVAGHAPPSIPQLTAEHLRFALGAPAAPIAALATPAAPLASPLPASRLGEEADLLARALGALQSGGPASQRAARALEALDLHHRRFPSGILTLEAGRARVEALLLAGRRDEALAARDRLPSPSLRPRTSDR